MAPCPRRPGTYQIAGAGGAGGSGVALLAGGALTNDGSILGGRGGDGGADRATPPEAAAAAAGDGVDLRSGATLLNRGAVSGGLGGAGGAGHGGAPDGGDGRRGDGVALGADCGLTNVAGATISGGIGVHATGAGVTVTNFGTISGDGRSVSFDSASDVLVVENGARFIGDIAGGGGTFQLVRGGGAISGLGGAGVVSGTDDAHFSGFGAYVISGTEWTVAGTNALSSGQSLTAIGQLSVSGSIDEAAGAAITAAAGAQLTFLGGGDSLRGTVGGAGLVSFIGVKDLIDGAELSAATVAIKDSTVTLKGDIVESGVMTVTTSTLVIGGRNTTLSARDRGAGRLRGQSGHRQVGGRHPHKRRRHHLGSREPGRGADGPGQPGGGVIEAVGLRALILDTGADVSPTPA